MEYKPKNDLTGQRFGALTVIEFSYRQNNRNNYWKCQCDCGKTKIQREYVLKTNPTPCSCTKTKKVKVPRKDLTGQRFNTLTVIEFSYYKYGHNHWKCQCDYRKTSIVREYVLKSKPPSCFCEKESSKDLIGQRFVMLTVIEFSYYKYGHNHWKCQCDCGKTTIARAHSLLQGIKINCGCLKIKPPRQGEKRIRGILSDMKRRCSPNAPKKNLKLYFERGIRVCDEWCNDFTKFKDWALSNGYQDHLSIDRIDRNKNYTPENCRWATNEEQQNNKITNVFITFKEKTQTIAQWAREYNITDGALRGRIRRGMSFENALIYTPHKNKSSQVFTQEIYHHPDPENWYWERLVNNKS